MKKIRVREKVRKRDRVKKIRVREFPIVLASDFPSSFTISSQRYYSVINNYKGSIKCLNNDYLFLHKSPLGKGMNPLVLPAMG